jgi:hypothetical protein
MFCFAIIDEKIKPFSDEKKTYARYVLHFFSAEAIWNTRYTQFGSVFLILLEIQWKTIPMFIATCSCHEITLVVAAWRG